MRRQSDGAGVSLMRFFLALAIALGGFSGGSSVSAQEARPDRVTIEYVPPANPAHREIHDRLRERRGLETLQQIFSPLKLPRPLAIRTAGCEGEINAWFEGDAITICYEYMAWIAEVARKPSRPAWVTEEAAMLGPFLEVALHEGAHAIFDYLEIPILGREEDAADQIAALWLLTLAPERAAELIAGVAATYLDEAGYKDLRQLGRKRLRFGSAAPLADVHSTPIQRLYNLLCLAYGADPKRFGALASSGALPAARAEGCEDEHRQVARAYAKLLKPHVDPEIAERTYGARRPETRP
jgi:hypothetical protein